MATARMDVTAFVGKLLEEDDVDLLREGVRVLAQALMETEVSSQIGAAPYERNSGRPRAAFELALEHEQRVRAAIHALSDLAVKEGEHAAQPLLLSFISEQG